MNCDNYPYISKRALRLFLSFPVPKSWTLDKCQEMVEGTILPVKRPEKTP